MKPLIFALCVVFAFGSLSAQTPVWQPSPGHTQVPIWPGTAPDAQPVAGPEYAETTGKDLLVAGRPAVGVSNVSRPTMTVYSPKGKNTGAAVVVFPGGGYQVLAIDLEGTEVCDWLTSKGITCVLLKYRVPTDVEGRIRNRGRIRNHRWRWKMRRGRWGWCAFTRRSGISIRTRLECLDFRQAGICRQRSARTLRSVCIRLSMRPTKKAAARILRWLFIRGICRFPRRNGMLSKAQKVCGSSSGDRR